MFELQDTSFAFRMIVKLLAIALKKVLVSSVAIESHVFSTIKHTNSLD